MRIRYAKRLLRSGEYSVTDAAMLLGFSDTAYFSREFKRSVGMSPSEYLENSLA
jgi:AraC-like DNA-binding protein